MGALMVKVLDIKQQSPEWHELRKIKLGASCAPVIMGFSEYYTPFELYEEMKGIVPKQEENWGMRRGNSLEEVVIKMYEEKEGIKTAKLVGQSDEHESLIASLDAVCVTDYKKCAEIKCIALDQHELTYSEDVPYAYFCQMQHQMFVWDLKQIDYVSYCPGALIPYTKTVVKRDPVFLCQYIPKALEFIEGVLFSIPPAKTEKDVIDCSADMEFDKLELDYMHFYNQYQLAEKEKERCRLALIDYAKGRRVKGTFLKVTKYKKDGSVDYKKIAEIQYLNLDKYRGPALECFRITRV